MRKYGEYALSALKYLIVLVTIEGAIGTMIGPLRPMDGALGFIYGHRPTLVVFGVVVLICALILLYGKLAKSKKWTGIGLMSVYLCYTFAALLNLIALGDPSSWVGNLVVAIITGLLWLRWRFKTEYINPRHFKDAVALRYEREN